MPLATALGMRLNEQALHGWDAEVGLDPTATLTEESAALLAEHFSSTMTFLLGFVGKPDQRAGPVRVGIGGYTIVIADARAASRPGTPTPPRPSRGRSRQASGCWPGG